MSDFLIQTIDLDNIRDQAVDYGRGLQMHMIENVMSAEDVAKIACATPNEIHYLVAGTSDMASILAKTLWTQGKIGIETMILAGSGFPGGSWTSRVLAVH